MPTRWWAYGYDGDKRDNLNLVEINKHVLDRGRCVHNGGRQTALVEGAPSPDRRRLVRGSFLHTGPFKLRPEGCETVSRMNQHFLINKKEELYR